MNNYQLTSYLSKAKLILISKNNNPFPTLNGTRPLIAYLYLKKIVEQSINNKLNQNNSTILETYSY